jgi:acyl-CoA dehydrogenase
MDFADTPEEAEFRAEARAWLDANAERRLAPGESAIGFAERDDPDLIKKSQAWQAKKADAGWACLTWPTEYGGRGVTSIQNVIWNQEEGRYKTPPNIFGIGIGMLGPTLMAHGTDAQKATHLKRMARGDDIWCQLFSEPSAGSDLAGLRMSAVKDGDEWVINGQKIWTTGAHYCKWGMVVTRTDPNAAKHAGLTYFIVDMKSPGVEPKQIKQINGAAGFNEVFFTDVRVPDSNRISEVGNGWAVSITTLMNERASIGGGGGGTGFNELVKLAKSTELDGRSAFEDSAVRQQLADFYITRKGLQYTGYRTLTALSRGTTPGPENSIGKLIAAPMGQKMAAFALELMGEAGGTMGAEQLGIDDAWQESYLGAPGMRIAGGTDEIMRNIIAERVLRLPPEVRLDKNVSFKDIPSGSHGS